MSQDDLPTTWEEIADGLALWEEHKPAGPEDWICIARLWTEHGDSTEDVSHMFKALVDAVAALTAIAETPNPRDGYPLVEVALQALGESDG